MMIDTHLHLFKIESENYVSPDYIMEKSTQLWSSFSRIDIEARLEELSDTMRVHGFEKGLLHILNDRLEGCSCYPFSFPKSIIPSYAINVLKNDVEDMIDNLLKHNIRFVKLLPYEQQIFREHYPTVLESAKKLQDKGIIITICCSYGSRYLYKTNGVELAAYLVNGGIKTPIIMAHGGMLKVFDAMSLMMEFSNLYMDTSFSIPYWWNSSVVDDYHFAFEKLGFNRIFYGSDYPYISMEESLSYFSKFCKRYNVTDENREKILCKNFERLLSNHYF